LGVRVDGVRVDGVRPDGVMIPAVLNDVQHSATFWRTGAY
jgi:hypothetical protein